MWMVRLDKLQALSNLLSARSLDAARDGPCAHGNCKHVTML